MTIKPNRSANAGPVARSANEARSGITVNDLVLLHWLSAGHTNMQIGANLGRSEKTVRNQLTHLYRKLGVVNRAQAVAAYLREHAAVDRALNAPLVTRSGHSSHWSNTDSQIRLIAEVIASSVPQPSAIETADDDESQ